MYNTDSNYDVSSWAMGERLSTKVSRSDELIFHTDASVFRYHLLLSRYSHSFFRTYYFIYFVCTKQHLVILSLLLFIISDVRLIIYRLYD